MKMAMNAPSLEDAYGRLRPMFFAALGNLARRGFVAQPFDGMDIIHDFFVESWQGLENNFDPSKGSFEGYAYGAFVRFARPRIVRLQRWRRSLVGLGELDAFEAKGESSLESPDRELVQQALGELSREERELLLRVFTSDSFSERSLAKDFGVSRYRIHEMVVDALAHFAALFDRPSKVRSQDWIVVRALWKERRTIAEASTILDLTPQQVRVASKRYFGFLSDGLRQNQRQSWSYQRRIGMYTTTRQAKAALVLLQKALTTPGNIGLLEEVRTNAKDIMKVLEEVNVPAPVEELDGLAAEWVAQVYEAIFEGAGMDLSSEVAEANKVEAHEAEDRQIGSAFRDVLLADLSPEMQRPREIASLGEISSDEQARLKKSPDVAAGQELSLWWLAHGVRPLTVFLATKCVATLLQRYVQRGLLENAPIVLQEEFFFNLNNCSRHSSGAIRSEIARRAECSPKVAEALYSWILRLAQYKPWLFLGFEANPGSGGNSVILLSRTERTKDVYPYWGIDAPLVQEKASLASTH